MVLLVMIGSIGMLVVLQLFFLNSVKVQKCGGVYMKMIRNRMKFFRLILLVIMVQLIIGGKVLVVLLIMMFCGVECFSYMEQIIMQKKIVKVRNVLVNQLIIRLRVSIELMESVMLNVKVFFGVILLVGIGCFCVCVMILLIFVLYYMFRVLDVLVFMVMYRIVIVLMIGCMVLGVSIMLIKVVKMISDMIWGFRSVIQLFMDFILFFYMVVFWFIGFWCLVSDMGVFFDCCYSVWFVYVVWLNGVL